MNQYDDDARMKQVLKFVQEYTGAEGISPKTLRNALGIDKIQSKVYLHRLFKRGILVRKKDRRHRIVRGWYEKVVALPPEPMRNADEESVPHIEEVKKEETPLEQVKPQQPSPPIQQPDQAVSDEQREEMHQPDNAKSDLKFHAYTFVLKRLDWKDSELLGYSIQHSMVNPSNKEFIEEQIPALELFEPFVNGKFNPRAISELWNTKGYIYNEYFKSYTGSVEYDRNRTIRFEVFENNTVNIYVECTKNPLNALEVLSLYGVIKAMIKVLTGLDGDQLSNLIMVKRVEPNIDREMDKDKIDATALKCINMTTWIGDHIRLYLKNIDKKTLLRIETTRNPNQPISQFMVEMDALTFGGVTGLRVQGQFTALQAKIDNLANKIEKGFERFLNAQAISPEAMSRQINSLDKLDKNQGTTNKLLAEIAERLGHGDEPSLAPSRPSSASRKARKRRGERELSTFEPDSGAKGV